MFGRDKFRRMPSQGKEDPTGATAPRQTIRATLQQRLKSDIALLHKRKKAKAAPIRTRSNGSSEKFVDAKESFETPIQVHDPKETFVVDKPARKSLLSSTKSKDLLVQSNAGLPQRRSRYMSMIESLPCRRKADAANLVPAGIYYFRAFNENEPQSEPLVEKEEQTLAPQGGELSKAYSYLQTQMKQLKLGIDACLNCIDATKQLDTEEEFDEKRCDSGVEEDEYSEDEGSVDEKSYQNEAYDFDAQSVDLDSAIRDLQRAGVNHSSR